MHSFASPKRLWPRGISIWRQETLQEDAVPGRPLQKARCFGRVTLVLALATTVWLTGLATAGTNGQQVSFCATSPDLAGGYAVATGENQAGKTVTTEEIALRGNGHCENVPDWWFRDTLCINWFEKHGDVARSTVCEVPQHKRRNWHQCFNTPVHVQLAEYIHSEITRNSQSEEVQEIKHCLDESAGGFPGTTPSGGD